MLCLLCASPFVDQKMGRPRKFCSRKCASHAGANAARERARARGIGSVMRAGTCAICACPVLLGQTSALQGTARCNSCRARLAKPNRPSVPSERTCPICAVVFVSVRRKYCDEACALKARYRRGSGARVASTNERGYGSAHQRLRRELLPSAYGTPCVLCGEVMTEDQTLHLDHTVDRSAYRGFAHAKCNLREGSARGNQRQSQLRRDRAA